MRLHQRNSGMRQGGGAKAFESAMCRAGESFRGFHDGRFRLGGPWPGGAADGNGDGNDREESWKAMLEALFGEVPEGEETPPPCDFLMMPEETAHHYCGVPAQLPPEAGRVEDFPFPVRNQFDRGACFAFAMTALCEHGFAKRGRKTALSEQSLYCFTKQETRVEVDEQHDGVEHLRDAVRAVERWGVAPLEMWPYDPNADGWNFVNYAGDCAALVQAASAFRWGYWKSFRGNSVAELKEWLAKGHAVCIGAHTTPAWQAGTAVSDGTIPYFPQHWKLLLDKASALRAMQERVGAAEDDGGDGTEDAGEDGGEEGVEDNLARMAALLSKMQEANADPGSLLKETQDRLLGILHEYTGQPVRVVDCDDEGRYAEVKVELAPTGGHAVCLLGYKDDPEWPGGGYFVARNSWGEEWGWPEHPGHGRIPYEYMAQMGMDAYAMLYEAGTDVAPEAPFAGFRPSGNAPVPGNRPATAGRGASGAGKQPASVLAANGGQPASPGTADDGFAAWCKRRTAVLQRPVRDSEGVMRRAGTPVLVPDPLRPAEVVPDTPANREALRPAYEEERRLAQAEALRTAEAEKAAREAALLEAVRATLDGLFADGRSSISPRDILAGVRARGFADLSARELRPALLALQREAGDRYAFCVNRYGDEEVRPPHLAGGLPRVSE